MDIQRKNISPTNYTEGRQDNDIVAIVVHWIVGTLESADATFKNPSRNASAHYGVGDHEVYQWVSDENTAWHCGDWLWNLKTIGIENEGGPDLPISDATYETSAKLIKELCTKYNIPIDKEHILPHNHFVATQCPGDLDIDRLIKLALGNDDCQEEIDRLIDEVAELSSQRDRKDRKLETCRDERTEYKSELQQTREEYQKQVAELNQTNASLKNEATQLRERRDKLEAKVVSLEEELTLSKDACSSLEKKLTKEHQNYTDLEEKYTELRDKSQNYAQNISLLKFIWLKLRG